MMDEEMYFTIVGFKNYHGLKPFKVGGLLKLIKDKVNTYDDEAIAVEMRYAGKVGYVGNSTNTVFRGTMSAGRLYDKIADEGYAQIKFIGQNSAIGKILSKEEVDILKEDPDCDFYYI